MGIVASLNRLERHYAWSLLGFVLAAIFGGITLYTSFLRDTRPDLRFEIVSDASVLDVREALSDLQIVYGGIDIRKSQQALRVLVVRVSNVGLQDILRDHYDDRSPLGFNIRNGSLLRVETLSASNDYIRRTLTIKIDNPQTAVFSPVIIESQEWVTLKCLIIHADNSRPSVEPIGKVAGVRSIKFVDTSDSAERPGFWSRTLSGGLWTQVARFGIYSVAFLGSVAAFVGAGTTVAEVSGRRRRRRKILQFKAITTRQLDHRDEFIFDYYLSHGVQPLHHLNHYASDAELLKGKIEAWEARSASHRPVTAANQLPIVNSEHFVWSMETVEMEDGSLERHQVPLPWIVTPRVEKLIEAGILKREGDVWTFDEHAKETIVEFIRFVKPKKVKRAQIGDVKISRPK